MSCAPGPPTFRLLDHLVGWDPLDVYRLTDPDDPGGIQLAPAGRGPARTGGTSCRGCLTRGWPPAAAAAPGTWPHRGAGCSAGIPAAAGSRSGRRTATPGWPDARTRSRPAGTCWPRPPREAVYLWRREGEQLAAVIPGPATALAIAPWGEILLARDGSADLSRFDLAGSPARPDHHRDDRARRSAHHRPGAHPRRRLHHLGADRDRRDVAALARHPGQPGSVTSRQRVDDLAAAVDRTSLTVATDQGFCLAEPGPDGDPVTSCFSWDAEPLDSLSAGDGHAADGRPAADHGDRQRPATLPLAPGPRRRRRAGPDQRAGGGRHQRGTHAARDDRRASPRDGFPAGPPNPDDWQDGGAASADFLVDQAPGRYLYVRLRLTGDGTATPVVHRIRLDFPRVTSADQLPAVYTQDPAAADFTERFLSLFDAAFDEADRAVERYPALLDPGGVPDEVLPWLGGLLGLAFDPGWDATIRRNLLAAAPAPVPRARHPRGAEPGHQDRVRHRRGHQRARRRPQLGGAGPGQPAGIHPAVQPVPDPVPGRQLGPVLGADPQLRQSRRRPADRPGQPDPGAGAPGTWPRRPGPGGAAPAGREPGAGAHGGRGPARRARPRRRRLVRGRRRHRAGSAAGSRTRRPAPPPGAGQPVTLGRHSVLWPSARGSWAGIRPGAGLAVGMNTVAQ